MKWLKIVHIRDLVAVLINLFQSARRSKLYQGDIWIRNPLLYPINLELFLKNEEKYYSPKDHNGIPMSIWGKSGAIYSPTRIAEFALAHFNYHLMTGDKNSQEAFLKAVDWFMRPADGLWRYDFDWGRLRRPWISAMAQGQGISVLTRAYALLGEEAYLKQASRATLPFLGRLEEGGVRSKVAGSDDFLEEWPSSPPSHTLNGFLFAIIGIIDLGRYDVETVERIDLAGLAATLTKHVNRWDLGYWSAYDMHVSRGGLRNPCTFHYHALHVAQLRYIGQIMHEPTLIKVADRWASYESIPVNRLRAVMGKVAYRLIEPGPRRR